MFSLRFEPLPGGLRGGRSQGERLNVVRGAERLYALSYALLTDKGLTAGKNERTVSSNLFDQLSHLTPREFVPIRIGEFIESVDCEDY